MKKLGLLCVILVSKLVFAQDYHITYNFKYKEDSLSSNYSKRDFVLQIEPKKTKFILSDMILGNKPMAPNSRMFYDIPMEQGVERNKDTNEFTNYSVLNQSYYKIMSNDPIEWKIEKDTKEENGYQLQKATTTFGKRNWEAWFITSIPINEGPFKFHGLPGLIYSVQDSKSNFIYNLVEIKKLTEPYDTTNIIETHFGTKPILITLKKYHELIINDYSNPYADYRGMKEGQWSIMPSQNRMINTIKDLNEYSKEYQADLVRKNNPVELNKAVHFPTK